MRWVDLRPLLLSGHRLKHGAVLQRLAFVASGQSRQLEQRAVTLCSRTNLMAGEMTRSAHYCDLISRHCTYAMGIAVLCLCLPPWASAQDQQVAADHFATLALACVHQEYPNHVSHSMQSDADVAPPRELTPAFYGCLDWHSSVHGHWLLARLARQYPESEYSQPARKALAQSLTREHFLAETAYVSAKGRRSFERP